MFGFFGTFFLAIIWTGFEFLGWCAHLLYTFFQMLAYAIWCGDDSAKHRVCRHTWVIWIRRKLGHEFK